MTHIPACPKCGRTFCVCRDKGPIKNKQYIKSRIDYAYRADLEKKFDDLEETIKEARAFNREMLMHDIFMYICIVFMAVCGIGLIVSYLKL